MSGRVVRSTGPRSRPRFAPAVPGTPAEEAERRFNREAGARATALLGTLVDPEDSLQSRVRAAPPGTVLRLGPFVYELARLNVDRQVAIVGSGAGTILRFRSPAGAPLVVTSAAAGFSIERLVIDAEDDGAVAVMTASFAADSTLAFVEVRSKHQYGVYATGCKLRVAGCLFSTKGVVPAAGRDIYTADDIDAAVVSEVIGSEADATSRAFVLSYKGGTLVSQAANVGSIEVR